MGSIHKYNTEPTQHISIYIGNHELDTTKDELISIDKDIKPTCKYLCDEYDVEANIQEELHHKEDVSLFKKVLSIFNL
jgi:hypothetical protein